MSNFHRVIAVLVLAGAVAAVLALKHVNRTAGFAGVVTVAQAPPAATRPRLVDLGAGKCAACKMMTPILAELKKQYAGTFDVEFIDVWQDPDAGKRYGIRVIPTQIFYDAAGKELFRHEGFYGKDEILAKWAEHGVAPDMENQE